MSDIAFDIIGRDRASAAFRSVGKSAQGANKEVTGFGTSLKSHIGKFAALTAGSLGAGALIGFAKSAIDTEKSYSTSMRTIKAATNATGAQMNKLNKQAIDLGQKTVFSAGDAAAAMLELGKAGQNAGQIMQTVPQVMNLAATEGMGLADAAGVVTSALAQFGLKARKSAVVVNALAGASNASKASVASMSEALNYGGAAAHAVGLTVQETSGALAALAQHGQEGSVAGSALASVFNHLQPQTVKASNAMRDLGINFVNANGSFKSISQIAQILQSKLGGLTPAARKADISAIFGRNASSIAAVLALMNEGAKGINRYTKASSDMGAAQRLAAARMGGTAGAIEQMNGAIDTAKLQIGLGLAPTVIKVSNYLAKNLVPATDRTISVAKELGKTLNSTVIPPLKVAGELVLDAAKFFNGLPGPLKSVGVEAGIAALVFPRLAAGVATATTAIKDQITYARVLRLEMAEGVKTQGLMATATSKLGGAMKMAAGVGGMVALTEGMKSTRTEGQHLTHALEKTAGAAAIGFSQGGPVGAAVGTVAGLAASFHDLQGAFNHILGNNDPGTIGHLIAEGGDAAEKASTAMRGYRRSLLTLQATIDSISGKKTVDTRVKALSSFKSNYAAIYAQLKQAGVTDRALAFAVSGNRKATSLILKTLTSKQGIGGADPSRQFANVASAINDITMRTQVAVRNTRNQISVTRHLTGLYKVFPKKVVSDLKINGIVPSLAGVKKVAEQYKVVGGKKLTALIKASGWEPTKKQVESLTKALQKVPNVKPDVTPYVTKLGSGISAGKPKTTNSLMSLLTSSTQGSMPTARTSSFNLGSFYGQGYVGGILSKVGAARIAGASLGNAAKQGTQSAQKSNSPSKIAHKLGGDFGNGYRNGLRASRGGAMSAGVALIESLVKGIDKHKVRVKDVLGKLTSYIKDQVSKINDLTAKRNGLLSGFSSSVFGATFQDAEGNDRAGSVQDLIAYQQQQQAQAAQLQADIKSLISKHASKNLIQQMLSEGASGIANIHTLAGATASQIATINQANAAAQSSLVGGSQAAAEVVTPGIGSKIAQAKRDKATAEAMAAEFRKVLREEKKDTHVYVEIDGHTLHTLLLKERQKKRAGLGLG